MTNPSTHQSHKAHQSHKDCDPNRVRVFDTSLRDGEQAPGFSLGVADKLKIAHALKDLGVDIIESGFAAASPGDEEAVRLIANEVKGPTLCSLSRALNSDLEACARALEGAGRSRVHIFLATSPIHRAAKLKKTRDEVMDIGVKAVTYAATLFDEVEFSPEDAIRTEPDFLDEICLAVVGAGAKIINVPDTVGYSTPPEIFKIFTRLKAVLSPYDEVILSTHCHNDLGLAVANSLSALEAGARQVECTLNGIGERAGNAALEEVIMALRTRFDLYGLTTGIDATKLSAASRLLSRATGSVIVRNKAIVGKNAFAHESGIHQHGMLSDARTYEIMRPEDVGVEKSNLVLGKHSGRHAIAKQAQSLGFVLDEATMNDVFTAFKVRADEIGEIDEPELHALLSRSDAPHKGVKLLSLDTKIIIGGAQISLCLCDDKGEKQNLVAEGLTSLDAGLMAISAYFGIEASIVDSEILQAGFNFNEGAFAEVSIKSRSRVSRGRSRGPDGVWAGIRAIIDAFEKSNRSGKTDDMVTSEIVSSPSHT